MPMGVSFAYIWSQGMTYGLLFIDCLNGGSGMTNSNYTELNLLYQKYKDEGLLFYPFLFSIVVELYFCCWIKGSDLLVFSPI